MKDQDQLCRRHHHFESAIMPHRRTLSLARVQETIAQLQLRVEERFPGSGLSALIAEVGAVGREVERESASIMRPIWWVWALIAVTVLILGTVIVLLIAKAPTAAVVPTWTELAQGINAISSELVLLVGLLVFLASWQMRIRRGRVVAAVRQLRELAHIVDMLQLTKDPDGMAGVSLPSTAHSPRRELTLAELARYLDYCSELLS
ncbi:MAG: hypothetical protein AAB263_10425, partial [Planctomycetota bacterium]